MDTLGNFLRSIGKIPLLTAEEEITLARQIHKGLELAEDLGDQEPTAQQRRIITTGKRAKKRMITSNLRLVVTIAKKYQYFSMDLLDLIQEGTIGLDRAVEKFDPERGYKFSTYSYWWIRQSITRAIETQSRTIRLPLHLSELRTRIQKISRDYELETGQRPTPEYLAEVCGCSADRIREVITAFTPIASLNATGSTGSSSQDERSSLIDIVADPTQEEAAEAFVMQQDANEKLHLCLSCLTERERLIVVRYYGLDNEEPISLSKIAGLIKHKTAKDQPITRERVRQIKARAITKMKLRSGQINSARCNIPGNMQMKMPKNNQVPIEFLPKESQLAFA